ncbi:ABC transporter permease [Adhaeribacter soli]|uniref:ABC transporter permease n=1 Tax=Adhaeribacter soli TaxID=2607655 RepID=A0A5N1IH96_9BACT|nr:ABC transporter permease [Adhaeribacter soli]KAA9325033.1 ABC transporter permease [Adhaeribacter soli]
MKKAAKKLFSETGPGFKLAVFYLLAVLFLALAAPVLPLKFGANELQTSSVLLPPAFWDEEAARQGHWFGTDSMGRDVLANLIFGFRTGFQVAIPVISIAFLIGILLGSIGAYFGNRKLTISRGAIFALSVCLFLWYYYGLYLGASVFGEIKWFWFVLALLAALVVSGIGFKWLLKRLPFFRKQVFVPADELVLKTTEVLTSVPRLILVLSLAAVSSPGIGNILLLLSLTYWSGPARLVRGEVLRIKELSYTEAARVSGVPVFRLLFRHILPNAAGPLITAFAFGLGNLLALEATLSFLGIGLPPETPSWGRMLAEARLNPDAWWLLFFPVLCLCLTILAVQAIGNGIRQKFI